MLDWGLSSTGLVMCWLRESFDYDYDCLVSCTNTRTLFVAPMVLMVHMYGAQEWIHSEPSSD